jgi:Cysteine rich repeat
MRNVLIAVVVIGLVLLAGGKGFAQQKLVDTVVKGCEKELMTYCKDVTPGEGRGLACLYAFEDKLSAKCEYALYDAAAQLERAVAALSYAVNECRGDLQKFCSDIKPGQGRLLNCLNKNEKDVSKRCKDALKETGLK